MTFKIPTELSPYLRESQEGDAALLAPTLRAMDKKEIKALSHRTPLDALQWGALCSSPAFTLFHPDTKEVLGMGGLSQPGNVVWLLLSKHLLSRKELRPIFIRSSRKVCRWLLSLAQGNFMGNVTLPENKMVLRWLIWMGAETDAIGADHPDNQWGREVVRFMFYDRNMKKQEDDEGGGEGGGGGDTDV